MPRPVETPQEEYLRLLEEEALYRAQRRLFRLYPDDGPLRRELYPKHMAFFAAGAEHQERCFMAANRCLTLDTAVETDRGERLIAEIAGEPSFGVVSWADGRRQRARASAVFPKGIEPAFRLLMDNGEVFECSRRHRVLTVEGWLSLARLVRRADGQRWWHTTSSCPANRGVLEWLHAAPGTAIFYPSVHPAFIGGNRIVAMTGIGCKQIVDFEVPSQGNYMAGGVVHHNSGKSTAGCYELTCHMIGWYPPWWRGYRFDRPIVAWASGEDSKAVRESLQVILFGAPGALGTGLIPHAALHGKPTARGGVPEAIDAASIKTNFGGGQSRIVLKSYDQGRESFQASKVDVVLLDEEPPMDIYTEGLTRTMSTVPGQKSGIVMCTFTPLKGLSAVALAFMPGGQRLEGAVA